MKSALTVLEAIELVALPVAADPARLTKIKVARRGVLRAGDLSDISKPTFADKLSAVKK